MGTLNKVPTIYDINIVVVFLARAEKSITRELVTVATVIITKAPHTLESFTSHCT